MLTTIRILAKRHLPPPLLRILRPAVRAYFTLNTEGRAFLASRTRHFASHHAQVRRRIVGWAAKAVHFRRERQIQELLVKAERLANQRDIATACNLLQETLQKHPSFDAPRRTLAVWLLAENQPGPALEALAPSIAKYIWDASWVFPYLRAALRCGEATRATDAANDYIRGNIGSFHQLTDLAHLFREEGHDEGSVAIFKQIRLHAALMPERCPGNEGFVAAACEYAGYSHEAEDWDARYEHMRESEVGRILGPEFHERPIYLGRLASSLGDLASRFDALIKLEALGMINPRSSPVYLPKDHKVGNAALVSLIERHVRIERDPAIYQAKVADLPWVAWRDYEKILLKDGRLVHNTLASAIAEKEWCRQQRKPVFHLSEEMLAAGRQKLAAMGFTDKDWFVALHVREPGYYNEAGSPLHNASLHRCAAIDTFAQAVQWILDQGGWVIRLGDPTMAPPPITHERFIDYAHADWREDWLDLFFLAEARYILATNSGPMCLATALGTVVGITNYVPIAMPPLSPRNLFIPKLLRKEDEDRFLTIAEMLKTPFRMANRAHLFRLFEQKLGVKLIDNTAEEIFEFTRDLHAFCERGAKEIFAERGNLAKIFEREACHYVAQLGPSFARRHAACIVDSVDPRFVREWDAVGDAWIQLDAADMRIAAGKRLEEGAWPAALTLFQAQRALGENTVTMQHGLGRSLNHLGRTAEAAEVLATAFAMAPDSGATLRELSAALRVEGRYEEAINHYRNYLKRLPNSISDWLDFGHCLMESGRLEEALRAYAQPARIVAAGWAPVEGAEGLLAASCAYAGQHDVARMWVAAYERQRDCQAEPLFRSGPIIISFGRLGTRIGDVAARFDLLKKGMALGLIELPSDRIVIDTTHEYVNSPYLELWRDVLPFSDDASRDAIGRAPWLQKRDLADIRMRDGRTLYYPVAYSIIEREWVRQNRPSLISLPESQIGEGWRRLADVGMRRGDWFVALHVREGGFFNESEVGPNSDHLHRSATVGNYEKAIDWIIAQGGWVVRIGDPSMTPLPQRARLFDYALSDIRSAQMDLFLMSQCRYLLGTNSGPMAVCTSFGVVCGITNYIPIGLPVCSPRNLMLPKMIFSKRENRYLTIDEMMSPPLGTANRFHIYKYFCERFGAELRENTPEEILAFAQDLHAWAESDHELRDPRHDAIREIFERHGADYISPFSKSWLDRYEAKDCPAPAPRKRRFEEEWEAVLAGDSMGPASPFGDELSAVSPQEELEEIEAGIVTSFPDEPRFRTLVDLLKTEKTAPRFKDLAEALDRAGAFGLAIRCLRCACALNPSDATVLESLGRTASLLGRLELALAAYRRYASHNPADHRRYGLIAPLALRAGEFKIALSAFEHVATYDPPQGYHGMGSAARGLRRPHEAIAHFKMALVHAPHSYSTCRELLLAAREANDFQAATDAFRRLKDLRKDDAEIDYDHVELLSQFKQTDAAAAALTLLAQKMVSDAAHQRPFAGRFAALLEALSLDTTTSPWTEALATVEDRLTEPATSVSTGGDALILGPAASYIDLLSRALINMTNLEADVRLHKLAMAVARGETMGMTKLEQLMADDPTALAHLRRAREQGLWAYNDEAEYLTTSAKTMVGMARLRNIQECVTVAVEEGIPGDLVECGVWRGGAAILMRGMLHALGEQHRHVWLCDSFQGLPAVDFNYEKDIFGQELGWVAVSEEIVRRNFAAFGLLDERVHFVKGWFENTLHKAPVGSIAVLRLDGDYYSSTMDILVVLYDRVSPGGFIIVDDYYSVGTCAEAIHAFLDSRGIAAPEMQRIDQHSVFWRKT